MEKSSKKRRNRIIKIVCGVLGIVAVVFLFFIFYKYINNISADYKGERDKVDSGSILISVVSGDTTNDIASKLSEAGIIDYPDFFKVMAKLAGVDTKLQVGKYKFYVNDSYSDIFSRLQSSSARETVRLTFAEGSEVSQIIDILVSNGVGTEERYRMIIDSWDFSYDWLPEPGIENRLEGYLFPDTYDFFLDESEENVINRFLSNFQTKVINTGIMEKAEDIGLTLHEAVTLGSIIQIEGLRNDYTGISSVFHNRLKIGMKLQSDATINYLLPVSERKARSTAENMKIDNPYNTYVYKGLPPTAICNAGYYAILAAVTPDISDYYYFCADGNGGTVFAKTLQEHEENVRKYLG